MYSLNEFFFFFFFKFFFLLNSFPINSEWIRYQRLTSLSALQLLELVPLEKDERETSTTVSSAVDDGAAASQSSATALSVAGGDGFRHRRVTLCMNERMRVGDVGIGVADVLFSTDCTSSAVRASESRTCSIAIKISFIFKLIHWVFLFHLNFDRLIQW